MACVVAVRDVLEKQAAVLLDVTSLGRPLRPDQVARLARLAEVLGYAHHTALHLEGDATPYGYLVGGVPVDEIPVVVRRVLLIAEGNLPFSALEWPGGGEMGKHTPADPEQARHTGDSVTCGCGEAAALG